MYNYSAYLILPIYSLIAFIFVVLTFVLPRLKTKRGIAIYILALSLVTTMIVFWIFTAHGLGNPFSGYYIPETSK